MATALHLPAEQDLEVDAAVNAADAAELEQADAAAAAVEEGDEEEAREEEAGYCETGDDSAGLDESDDVAADDPAGDPEATLLEEPADAAVEEAAESPAEAPGPQLAADPQSPARRLTPHQPPKSAALVAYEHRRAEARDRYEGTMFEFRKLESAAKAAKERWKTAEDALFEVLNEGGNFEEGDTEFSPAVSFAKADAASASVAAVEASESPAIESPSAAEPPSDAWRSESIVALNLKATIASKLIEEGYSTIGSLEDLRANTFAGGLKSIKGIGQAKADAIEDAILSWLSKNRDKEVLAAAREEAAAEEETAEAASDDAADAADLTAAAESYDTENSRYFADIEARSQAIFFRTGDLSGVSPEDCLSQQLDDPRYFEGGWEAYNAGNDLIDCGYVPGVERDDWLRGWMSAKLTNEEGWQGPGSEK